MSRRWVAELLNYPTYCAGLFVSGGNRANFVCFLAARQAKAGRNVRAIGMDGIRMRAYCSGETHTWIQEAADISGMPTDAIRWITTDDQLRMNGKFVLRAGIVNFRASIADSEVFLPLVVRIDNDVDGERRPEALRMR